MMVPIGVIACLQHILLAVSQAEGRFATMATSNLAQPVTMLVGRPRLMALDGTDGTRARIPARPAGQPAGAAGRRRAILDDTDSITLPAWGRHPWSRAARLAANSERGASSAQCDRGSGNRIARDAWCSQRAALCREFRTNACRCYRTGLGVRPISRAGPDSARRRVGDR